jgi:class 3 adenylate cyclase/pimeloyl-ACP methyl ester carboxylesterase
MAGPDIRYCTTADGVRIAYAVTGEGPPLLVCPFFLESFSLDHRIPRYMDFWEPFRARFQIIRFDPRSIGLSDRDVNAVSIETTCLDMEAVVKASGVKRVALWLTQTSGPYGLRFAATRKRMVSRVVVMGAQMRATQVFTADALRAYATLWRTSPEIAARNFADLSNRDEHPEVGSEMVRVYLDSVSGEGAARIFEAASEPDWDAEPYLSKITAPTLVIHRRGDVVMPYAAGQAIAAGIKGARLLPLDGNFNDYYFTDTDSAIRPAIAFLEEERVAETARATPGKDSVSPFRTVLVTDLVGHTAMMQRLGDAKGRVVLREHERITRDLLKQYGGAEVKAMGDGFMASFASVKSAMDCAIALQRGFAQHEGEPLQVRVGLDAGEPIEEDGDLFGSTVIMASRIAAQAGAGEILIPEPLRHLLSGKSYVYADRGETMLKGFEDAVRLYEVRWRA